MLKLKSFIIRSKQRQLILKTITKQKTPTQIAEETKLAISHVSRTLSEFKDKGIVECLTPDEKIGKLYALTKKGSKVLKSLF